MDLKPVLSNVLSDPAGPISDFHPRQIKGLVLWCRKNFGITITGSGVSKWVDQSGNGNHLLQGTDAARPAKQGDGSILFNGTSHFLKTAAFTLNQPETVYMLFKQVTWTTGDRVFDGNIDNSMGLFQNDNVVAPTGSPTLMMYAGNRAPSASIQELAIDTYGVIACVYNGLNVSNAQINHETNRTGSVGSNNAGGFTLGSYGGGTLGFSNIQVKEVAIYNTAHDAAQRSAVIDYLLSLL